MLKLSGVSIGDSFDDQSLKGLPSQVATPMYQNGRSTDGRRSHGQLDA
jgi:hypothetical protein